MQNALKHGGSVSRDTPAINSLPLFTNTLPNSKSNAKPKNTKQDQVALLLANDSIFLASSLFDIAQVFGYTIKDVDIIEQQQVGGTGGDRRIQQASMVFEVVPNDSSSHILLPGMVNGSIETTYKINITPANTHPKTTENVIATNTRNNDIVMTLQTNLLAGIMDMKSGYIQLPYNELNPSLSCSKVRDTMKDVFNLMIACKNRVVPDLLERYTIWEKMIEDYTNLHLKVSDIDVQSILSDESSAFGDELDHLRRNVKPLLIESGLVPGGMAAFFINDFLTFTKSQKSMEDYLVDQKNMHLEELRFPNAKSIRRCMLTFLTRILDKFSWEQSKLNSTISLETKVLENMLSENGITEFKRWYRFLESNFKMIFPRLGSHMSFKTVRDYLELEKGLSRVLSDVYDRQNARFMKVRLPDFHPHVKLIGLDQVWGFHHIFEMVTNIMHTPSLQGEVSLLFDDKEIASRRVNAMLALKMFEATNERIEQRIQEILCMRCMGWLFRKSERLRNDVLKQRMLENNARTFDIPSAITYGQALDASRFAIEKLKDLISEIDKDHTRKMNIVEEMKVSIDAFNKFMSSENIDRIRKQVTADDTNIASKVLFGVNRISYFKTGGENKPVRKLKILGRERRIYYQGKVQYVMYQKKYIKLSDAKRLEKQQYKVK